MSTTPPPKDRDTLAAEHALRLLEGQERAEAEQLERSDPAFAAAVAAWQERLAPLFDEVAEAAPDERLWQRIRGTIAPAFHEIGAASAIGAANDDIDAANDNAPLLERRLRLWRGLGIGASAIAASLALFVGIDGMRSSRAPEPAPAPAAQPDRAAVLIATLASQDADSSLSIAYDGERGSILVTPGRLRGARGRDHELWIIPQGGQPISLGLVRAGEPQRLPVRRELAPHFQRRAAIALSVEPAGGSPTGSPTGPVVATGELLDV